MFAAASKSKVVEFSEKNNDWLKVGNSYTLDVPEYHHHNVDDKKNKTKSRKRKLDEKKSKHHSKNKKLEKKKRSLKSKEPKKETTFVSKERKYHQDEEIHRETKERELKQEIPMSLVQEEESTQPLFEVDPGGDFNTLQFGSLYREDIPAYHSLEKFKLTRKGKISDRRVESHKSNGIRYFDASEETRLGNDSQIRRINLATNEKRIRRAQMRKLHSLENSSAKENKLQIDFLPVEPDEIIHLESEEGESLEQTILNRSKKFNEDIANNPHDVELWLDFIAFQDEFLLLNPSSKNQRKAVVEKQFSIVEKARLENPGEEKLDLVYLQMTIRQKEPSVVLEILKQYLDKENLEFWRMLRLFQRSQFSLLNVPQIREGFVLKLQAMRKTPVKKVAATTSTQIFHPNSLLAGEREDILQHQNQRLNVFLSACEFEKSAGYPERGIALFQALLEFNLFCPPSLVGTVHEVVLSHFERYWEEEIPRIGDHGANIDTCWAMWFNENVQKNSDNTTSSQTPPQWKDQVFQKAYSLSATPLDRDFNEKVERNINRLRHHLQLSNQPSQDKPKFQFSPTITEEEPVGTHSYHDKSSLLPMDASDEVLTYSVVHGYRIPIRESDNSTTEYQRILKEIRHGSSSSSSSSSSSETKNKGAKKLGIQDPSPVYHPIDEKDACMQWYFSEMRLMQTQWLPLRSKDHKKACDQQPERVIFYEEVRDSLFRVSGEQSQLNLVLAFLEHLGVSRKQIMYGTSEWTTDRTLNADEFSKSQRLSVLYLPLLNFFNSKVLNGFYSEKTFNNNVFYSGKTFNNLLYSENVYSTFFDEFLVIEDKALQDPNRVIFIRNVLHRSLLHFPQQVILQRILMEFESRVIKKTLTTNTIDSKEDDKASATARKIAKAILQATSASQTDLLLWESYARIEIEHGNYANAKRVCEIAISLSKNIPEEKQMDVHCLIRMRARMELLVGNETFEVKKLSCLYIILSSILENLKPWSALCKGKKIDVNLLKGETSEVRLLQAKSILETSVVNTKKSILETKESSGTIITPPFCYAVYNLCLFHSVCSGLEAAFVVMDQYRQDFSFISFNTRGSLNESNFVGCKSSMNKVDLTRKEIVKDEWLAMMEMDLIVIQQTLGHVPSPKLLRERILRNVMAFPSNPCLLSRLTEAEHQVILGYFSSRLRETQRTWKNPTLEEWVFFILVQFMRSHREASLLESVLPLTLTGIQKVRKSFEAAIHCPEIQCSSLLWRLYFRFELYVADIHSAKRVYFRGVHRCPWSKLLWLDGLAHLRPYMTLKEVDDIHELMMAKDICLRNDLYDDESD